MSGMGNSGGFGMHHEIAMSDLGHGASENAMIRLSLTRGRVM